MTEHVERLNPNRPLPIVSYGLPYEEAIARHLAETLHKTRPYLLVSGTLSRETDVVDRLRARLERDDGGSSGTALVGVRRGMHSHTLYADLLEVLADLRATRADAIVVVGGGSLVDAAKALAFALANGADSHEALDALHANPDDLDARLQAQRGASLSMQGVSLYGVELGASHGIGHQLGPQGVPHAETTCVLLPAVLKYNARVNGDQQAQVAAALWDDPVVAAVLQKQFHLARDTADLGDVLDAIIRALDLPRTLAVYGIGRDKLDDIAVNSLTDLACQTNPVPLTEKKQVLEILEACLGET
ncbi:Alcohol dehydrogenase, iron-type [Niveomyces insectorum RCEF 264]|uniref:Alcohol dehydrogenase, iron-type n=1 Tax=Niveomyces insectorum RCEF 264 TaxID=1081102 RepID=A0A167SEM8_9HYPO|nr:Alcohol dehydrogenase, iron-type [Niveomyces insectorum RCEF 264]